MGPPAAGGECGIAHIGGAKSIRLDALTPAASIGVCRSELGRALVKISYDNRPYWGSMC